MIGSIMMQGLWVLFIIETSENKLLYYKTATSKPWTYTSSQRVLGQGLINTGASPGVL